METLLENMKKFVASALDDATQKSSELNPGDSQYMKELVELNRSLKEIIMFTEEIIDLDRSVQKILLFEKTKHIIK